ncbi:hypothetical protein [Bradyrhizobium sp. USDA 3262]
MILSFSIELGSLEQFLDHWSGRYPDSYDPEKYEPYVGRPLSETSRLLLFEWKNGSVLSKKKHNSVVTNYPLSFPKNRLEQQYLHSAASGGAIWNIFYMHCIDPDSWPIFDQHTYRAMHFMKTGKVAELPKVKAEIYQAYKTEYVPFVRLLDFDPRKIDRALFAFGQFLKVAGRYLPHNA